VRLANEHAVEAQVPVVSQIIRQNARDGESAIFAAGACVFSSWDSAARGTDERQHTPLLQFESPAYQGETMRERLSSANARNDLMQCHLLCGYVAKRASDSPLEYAESNVR
jgi:hypothetical protein